MGTISGLREGELTLAELDRQLTEALDKIHRGGKPIQIVDFGICEEKHTKPDQEAFDLHFHFVVSASSRFDCDSKYFDLVGASGCKLRTHITPPENDEHWSNQIKYLVKEGVLCMNAFCECVKQVNVSCGSHVKRRLKPSLSLPRSAPKNTRAGRL